MNNHTNEISKASKTNSIACIELNSIARGFLVADVMLKAANVQMIFNRTICPGKFMVVIGGDVASVNTSLSAGLNAGSSDVVDSLSIANVHPDVFSALSGTKLVEQAGALGIIETFSVAAIIEAADVAVKAANIELIEIHLAMAIGGKGFVTFTGKVAAVEAAAQAAVNAIKSKAVLVEKVVIAQPRSEVLNTRM